MQGQEAAGSAESFAALRRTAIECQIRPFGVTDQRILGSFLEVPREKFIPAGFEPVAYSDLELAFPLAGGQGARAMLVPLALARLIQACDIGPTDRVLDVAGAKGYTAAVLSGLAGSVVALESDEALSKAAAANFQSLGLDNVEPVCGPLADGAARPRAPSMSSSSTARPGRARQADRPACAGRSHGPAQAACGRLGPRFPLPQGRRNCLRARPVRGLRQAHPGIRGASGLRVLSGFLPFVSLRCVLCRIFAASPQFLWLSRRRDAIGSYGAKLSC